MGGPMDQTRTRSRRALLTAAATGAAALAANAALPQAVVRAADVPLLLNVPNTPTGTTNLTAAIGSMLELNDTDPASTGVTVTAGSHGVSATVTADNGQALAGSAGGANSIAINGTAPGATSKGVMGTAAATGTGVFGGVGTLVNVATDTALTGVYGYSDQGDHVTTVGAGVWGDSPDIGVYGTGTTGVYGFGSTGVYGDGGTTGVGVYGYSTSGYGLWVKGKVRLENRSGRISVGAGKTYYTKTGLTGVTTSSIVIAVLQGARTGTWIRAAVPAAGKFTVYFNRALPSTTVVGWMILN